MIAGLNTWVWVFLVCEAGTAAVIWFGTIMTARFLIGSYMLRGSQTVAKAYIRTMWYFISWAAFVQLIGAIFQLVGYAYLDQVEILGPDAGYVKGVHVLYVVWISFFISEILLGDVIGYFNAFPGYEEFTFNRYTYIFWGVTAASVNILAHNFTTFFWPSVLAAIMFAISMVVTIGESRVKQYVVDWYSIGKYQIPFVSVQWLLYMFFDGGLLAAGVLSILTNPYVNVLPQSILLLTAAGIRFIQYVAMLLVVYFATGTRKQKSGYMSDLYPVYDPARRVALALMEAGIISKIVITNPAGGPEHVGAALGGRSQGGQKVMARAFTKSDAEYLAVDDGAIFGRDYTPKRAVH